MTLTRTDSPDDERRQLDAARRDLVAEFADRVPESEVGARFDEIARAFEGAPVRTFVPVLVGRAAREQLRQAVSA
ncbi:MAG TPA: hypothetical protein VNU26_07745 [Mycobacteriales bacterium]|nr:hypothetical protein [Mycobacteriales bacterium]